MDDLEKMMKDIYKVVSKINPRVSFRDKERRRTTRIKSRCCEYPLPVWDITNEKNEKVFKDLANKCTKKNERTPYYGIYGPSGSGKSHFIDHFCNEREFEGREKVEFVPISLQRMSPESETFEVKPEGTLTEKAAEEKQNQEKKEEKKNNIEIKVEIEKKTTETEPSIPRAKVIYYQRMMASRLLFSYFFEIDTNIDEMKDNKSKHQPNGSFSGFESCWKLVTDRMTASKVIPSFVVGLVGNEIGQLKKRQMIIVIDDIRGLGFAQQKEFISSLGSMDYFVIFSITFHGEEESLYYKVDNPTRKICRWKEISGTSLTQIVTSNLSADDDNDNDVGDGVLDLVLTQFGGHSRSYGVFYYAFKNNSSLREVCRKCSISQILNHFITTYWEPGSYGLNGALNLWMSHGHSKNFLLLLSVAMLKIPVTALISGGLITKSDVTEFFEAGIVFGDNFIDIYPICLNAWAVDTKKKREFEEARKRGITWEDSFSDVITSLFGICNAKFGSDESEKCTMLLILLRLNCGKMLFEHGIDAQFLSSEVILGFDSKIEIDYKMLPWSAIRSGKNIGQFGGIDSNVWESYIEDKQLEEIEDTQPEECARLKIDESLLVEQLDTIDFGIATTMQNINNIAFDFLLVVPVKEKNKGQHEDNVASEQETEEKKMSDLEKVAAKRKIAKEYIFIELKSRFSLFEATQGKVSKEEKNTMDGKYFKFCKIMDALGFINVNGCDGKWIKAHAHFVACYNGEYQGLKNNLGYHVIDKAHELLCGTLAHYLEDISLISFLTVRRKGGLNF